MLRTYLGLKRIMKGRKIMEIEHLVPDFDDFEKLINDVARLKAEVLVIKTALSQLEAQCMKEALTNKDYWIGGKMPSMSYCEKVVKELGNTEKDATDLRNLRTELANKTESYQLLQGLITLNRDKLDLHKSISFNQPKSFL